ncbi:hypothetical protein [Pontitalea aquivivens]
MTDRRKAPLRTPLCDLPGCGHPVPLANLVAQARHIPKGTLRNDLKAAS